MLFLDLEMKFCKNDQLPVVGTVSTFELNPGTDDPEGSDLVLEVTDCSGDFGGFGGLFEVAMLRAI